MFDAKWATPSSPKVRPCTSCAEMCRRKPLCEQGRAVRVIAMEKESQERVNEKRCTRAARAREMTEVHWCVARRSGWKTRRRSRVAPPCGAQQLLVLTPLPFPLHHLHIFAIILKALRPQSLRISCGCFCKRKHTLCIPRTSHHLILILTHPQCRSRVRPSLVAARLTASTTLSRPITACCATIA